MDVQTYLRTRKEALRNHTGAVKNYTVFDFNYIPDQPLMRDEAKTIIDAILRYAHTGIPKNLAIFGSRGSGKTLMMRYLAQELHGDNTVTILYCNIRNHNTSFRPWPISCTSHHAAPASTSSSPVSATPTRARPWSSWTKSTR